MIATAAHSIVGTLPTWILVAFAIFVAYRVSKGGGGGAVSELAKANEVLMKAVHEEREKREALGAEVRDLGKENAELKGRTDFASALAAAMAPLADWTAGHEQRAQERHEASMASMHRNTEAVLLVLERMAERYGPDPEKDHHG